MVIPELEFEFKFQVLKNFLRDVDFRATLNQSSKRILCFVFPLKVCFFFFCANGERRSIISQTSINKLVSAIVRAQQLPGRSPSLIKMISPLNLAATIYLALPLSFTSRIQYIFSEMIFSIIFVSSKTNEFYARRQYSPRGNTRSAWPYVTTFSFAKMFFLLRPILHPLQKR